MEIDEREYNTVVLAALLHDVGKGTSFGLGRYEIAAWREIDERF